MSVATEISRLQTAKAGIKSALEAKGVTVDSATTLDGYPQLVESIPSGGGGDEIIKGMCEGTLTGFTVPNGTTKIWQYQFKETHILTVDLKDSVTAINDFAFNACGWLTSVTNASKLSYVGGNAFQNCYSLQTIEGSPVFGNLNGYRIFESCRNLEIPIVMSGTTVGPAIFNGCSKIPSFTFLNYIKDGTSSSQAVWNNCSGCAYWDFTDTYITSRFGNKNSFNGCTGEVRIPAVMYDSWMASNHPITNESNVFNQTAVSGNVVTAANKYDVVEVYYKTTDSGVTLPSTNNLDSYTNMKFGMVKNVYDATTGGTMVLYGPSATTPALSLLFTQKTNIIEVDASNCSNINGESTFRNCTNITTVILPNGYTEVSVADFSGCTALTSITFLSSGITSVGVNAFVNVPSSGTIYCNSQYVDTFTAWKNTVSELVNWTVQAIS